MIYYESCSRAQSKHAPDIWLINLLKIDVLTYKFKIKNSFQIDQNHILVKIQITVQLNFPLSSRLNEWIILVVLEWKRLLVIIKLRLKIKRSSVRFRVRFRLSRHFTDVNTHKYYFQNKIGPIILLLLWFVLK